MALTKADLSDNLITKYQISRQDAKELVELFFHKIAQALCAGQSVKLSGFGNFELHDKNERPGRNPRTGQEVPVAARRVVTFHCGHKLRTQVESFKGTDEKK